MQAWLAAAYGVVGGCALSGLVWSRGLLGLAARRQPAIAQKRPTTAPEMLLKQVMACLPAASLVLNETRLPCIISPEANRQFQNCIGSIVRHPAFQSQVEKLLAQSQETTQPTEAVVVLDVPQPRVVRALFLKKTVPAAFLPEVYSKNPGGQITLVFVALHDETEAVVAEKQHTDFVAFASHELRTPLAALLGFIETLQGPAADDPGAQKEFLDIMAAQARRMQRLLDSLLYLSRVQMQEHHRPRDTIVVSELFQHFSDEARGLVAGKDVILDVQPVADQNLAVAGDIAQLLQVLMNLLENALKYGLATKDRQPEHTLRITVGCERAKPDVGWPSKSGVVLSVADTGPGISARHLPRITERFYRVARTAASVQGSGLGLAIVQHVIARHEGRLAIESVVGQGTTCRIWLPLAAGDCNKIAT